MRTRSFLPALFMFLLPLVFAAGETAVMIVTTATEPWKSVAAPLPVTASAVSVDMEVFTTEPRQVIDGFGGAFNEKGWVALSLLTPEKRSEALRALFDPVDGARFSTCRVPIGASDYAVDRYTLDEVKDDYGMSGFSIERDRKYLIPYIKAAMQIRPDLKVWGSAWTPPTWMKTSNAFDGGNMRDDPKVYDAYALYLARFLEAYRNEGINAYAVAVQNEPKTDTNYPSCLWSSAQFLTFIRDHAGPLFESRGETAEIWLATIQDADYTDFPQIVLNDPKAAAYVTTVGFQWDGLFAVKKTRINYPAKKIMQTETECGNWYWKPGFDPNKPQNDWAYGVSTWKKVRDYFNEGVNSYMLWNMVLDQEGRNLDSARPWPQNAALVVDTASRSLVYTPMYYAFKHFSAFVNTGARLLRAVFVGAWRDALAFRNPDGRIVVVMQNNTADDKPVSLRIADQMLTVMLPARSWVTLEM